MAHPFLVKDIALRSGTSIATVDRVLNQRGGVHRQTVRKIEQAMHEMEMQSLNVDLIARNFLLDVVMCAPAREALRVRNALQELVPTLKPFIFLVRHHVHDECQSEAVLDALLRIERKGSSGVLLMAPSSPGLLAAVTRLVEKKIPVITLGTDLPDSDRCTYVGLDNQGAGRTAAYLVQLGMGVRNGGVILALSSSRSGAEAEMVQGFRVALAARCPKLSIHEFIQGGDAYGSSMEALESLLQMHPEIHAVYALSTGCQAILQAFANLRRPCLVFIANGLCTENLELLRAGEIQILLHHDLREALRQACFFIKGAQECTKGKPACHASHIQVLTPFNLPGG